MPRHKIGRLWKFRKEEVDEWMPPTSRSMNRSKYGGLQ